MNASLQGVDHKLQRAIAKINDVYNLAQSFTDKKPFTVRVQKDTAEGRDIYRCVASKNVACGGPPVDIVLLSGEVLYQLRSCLDHLVTQLVILNGEGAKLVTSRKHQFPIFETPQGFSARSPAMIDGVSKSVADLIENEQPYRRTSHAPRNDMLWVLQDLNNTDKHRLIPITVVGIDACYGKADGETIFMVQSEDIVLTDEKVFFSFYWDRPHSEMSAEMAATVAFEQIMSPYGVTLGVPGVLASVSTRVGQVVEGFRLLF